MAQAGILIQLPWPPASLSGQNNGAWYLKSGIIKKHRNWAAMATLAADVVAPEGDGDIHVSATFYPPDRRGDRVRYPQRIQAYWDGIADALKINDRRFLPTYHFALPCKEPRVVICIGGGA